MFAILAGVGVVLVVALAAVILNRPDQASPPAGSTSAAGRPTATPGPVAVESSLAPGGSGVAMPLVDPPGWRRVFADDFPGGAVSGDWEIYRGPPPGDPDAYWDPSRVSVGDGLLTIGAWRDPTRGGRYVTGGLDSGPALIQAYGRYEIRFRMDQGTGVAYSLVLWPDDDEYPPAVDLAEDNGRDRSVMYASMHPDGGAPARMSDVDGSFTDWHTAGVEWTEGRLVFTLDGRVWTTMADDAVPDQPLKLALQTQAGYCGHSWEACPDASTPQRVDLQVDWVVVWAPA